MRIRMRTGGTAASATSETAARSGRRARATRFMMPASPSRNGTEDDLRLGKNSPVVLVIARRSRTGGELDADDLVAELAQRDALLEPRPILDVVFRIDVLGKGLCRRVVLTPDQDREL